MGKSFSYEDAVGQTASNGAFSYEDAINEAPKTQNKGIIGDTATDLKRGVEQLPGALTGLTDLVNPLTYLTGTRMADTAANWLGEKTGFQPSKWQEEAASEYSPERKASDEAISKAWDEGGAANIAGTIATNPRSILGVVGQSAPSMIAGGGAARLAMKGFASIGGTELAALSKAAQVEGVAGDAARETLNRMATTAGAIGEGAVTAGQNMDQVSRDVDPAKAAATSLAAGVITGGIGKVSGRVANKLGLPDVETAMAGGGLQKSGLPWYKRIPSAAAQEGLLQEFPQSAQEQIWQNLAEDKPWYDGALRQGVEGALAGGVMGGGAGLLAGRQESNPTEQPEPTTIAGLLPAPTSTGTPSEQVLQAEVARQNAVDAAQANADRIYAERDLYEETMKSVFPYGIPEITEPERIQEWYDVYHGVDKAKLKGLQRVQYQKALEKAYDEPVGITHDANGLEIPLTMGDLLNSQATVEITLREKRQQAIDNANAQAMARNDQVISEETAQQPDPIPVVGPLSAIANQAVKTGVAAQVQAQKAAAENPNGELTQNTADAQVATPSAPTQGSDVPGGGSILEPASAGVADSSGNGAEVAASGVRPTVATGGTSQESLTTQPQGTSDVPQAAQAVQAETQRPEQQPAAPVVRGYPQGQARMLAGRLTKNGYPSDIYPHPTIPGMFAIGIAGETADLPRAETVSAPVASTEQAKPIDENRQITSEQIRAEASEYPSADNFAYVANRKYGMPRVKAVEIWNGAAQDKQRNAESTPAGVSNAKQGETNGQEAASPAPALTAPVADTNGAAPVAVESAAENAAPKTSSTMPRAGESADEVFSFLKKSESGIVSEGRGILYPAIKVVGMPGTFQWRNGKVEKLGDVGGTGTVTKASRDEESDVIDAIEKDQAQIVLLSHWGGSGRGKETGQQVVSVLHSPRGMEYKSRDEWLSGKKKPAAAPKESIDSAAHEAATSPLNDTPLPTEAQKQAANYKMGHVTLHGLDISIENPKGSVRSGVDADGKPWENTLANHYGYIRGTEGNDGDHVDAFIGDNPESEQVFIVDQRNTKTGEFDEHKVLLGFNSLKEAKAGYANSYQKGWMLKGVISVTPTTLGELKAWMANGDMGKPFSKGSVPMSDRPLAAKGLTSYRYKGPFGWIMIGANSDSDALNQADRSLESGTSELEKLQKWNGAEYVDAAPKEPAPNPSNPAEDAKPTIEALAKRSVDYLRKEGGESIPVRDAIKALALKQRMITEEPANWTPRDSDGHPLVGVWLYKAEARAKLDDISWAITNLLAHLKKNGDQLPEVPEVKQKADEVPLSSVIDKVNAKNGEGLTEADRVPRQYGTMQGVDSAISGLYDGTISLDDYKAAFRGLIENKSQIVGELGKMTKDQLLGRLSPTLAYRLKSEKKAEIVDGAFEAIRNVFALRRSFGPNSYTMSAGGLARYEADKLAALSSMVESTTAEDLKAFSDEVSGDINQRKQKLEAAKNPKTIEDFDNAIRLKKSEGMTFSEARMSLTPEQRAEYDRLKGIESRDQRKARADQQKTEIRVAATTTEGQIVETKHTKTGQNLFVVKAAERVDRDVYNQWNATAKRLGGWYSSFRGNGAVPGFQFKTRESADAFLSFIGGNAEAAKEVVQERRDAFSDDRSQSAVERLNEMADRLEERADESLGRERKANTERRARFAASAEASANAEKAMATTMRRIASAIENGTAQFLDRVRQKAQVEYLASVLRTAKDNEAREESPNDWYTRELHKKPVTPATADYADFPQYAMMRSDLANLARKMVALPNMKMLGQRILKVADDTSAAYNAFAKEHLLEVSKFGRADGSGWANFSTLKDAERSIEVSNLAAVAVPLQIKRGEYRIVLSPSEAINRGIWKGDDKKILLTPEVGAEIVEKLGRLNRKNGQRRGMDAPPEAPWQFENAYNNRKRLSGMGIEQPWEFRAMLREFAGLKESPKEADKIKAMERAMIGRKNDGLDFFPTPSGTAQEMIDAAEIAEGMSVLEPSAGMGHIAEQIRDVAGVDPDVIEFNGDRRELLEAKGFNVVGSDFMEADGRYDRIIMNPPFSERRDAQHVQHAYGLLKPGGRLVAIMGEGVFFGQDKKAAAFRNWLEEVGGTSERLPEGSFLDPSLPVNTGVNARMVVINKPKGATNGVTTNSDQAENEIVPLGSMDGMGSEISNMGSEAGRYESDNRANEGGSSVSEQGGVGNQANDGRIQPADKAVYGMAAEGKSAAEILKFISSASRNPFNRQLAKLLQQTGINPTITVGDAKGWKFSAGDGKYSAAYNPATDTAALFRPAAAERNVLHELMHAATLKALAKKGMASAQMRALFEHVKSTGRAKGLFYDKKTGRGLYGMANVDEFVAEAFTNPKFQQALKKVKAPQGGTLQSAWHWFVRVVRGILGLKQGDESALSAALELGVGVMRENMDLADVGGDVRYAIETGKASQIDTPAFAKWFGGSKVVDAEGKPLVLYHGTAGDFATFDKAKSGGNWRQGEGAFFFTSRQRTAGNYATRGGEGANVMPVFLSVANPYTRAALDPIDFYDINIKQERESLEAQGYDGVIVKSSDGGGDLYVAFHPEQIKSSIGNNGDFDPSNPDIRYNVASDWYDANPRVKSVVENAFKSDSSTSFVNAFNTQYHKAKAWAAEGKPWFKEVFDHGQRFLSDVSRFAVMAQNKAPTLFHEIKSIGDVKDTLSSIKSIRDLTGRNHAADIDAIAAPLYEGTLAGGGSPMQGVVHSDADLRTKYKLSDRQIKLYREALAAVNVSMDEMVKSIIAKHAKNNDLAFDSSLSVPGMAADVIRSMEKLKQENAEDAAMAKRLDKTMADIKAVTAKNAALQEHGYFPLMRFGKHTVTARDADGKVQFFGMYEGKSMLPNSGQYQANKVAEEIRAEHPEWEVTTGINNTEKYKLYKGMNLEAVQLFAEHMDAESKEPFQEYLRQATNDRSVLKRLIEREGTPGFDRDVRRTLAQFIVSNARATSSSYHLYDMRKAAEAVPQQYGDIGKEAVNLYQYVSEPMEEAHALRGYLFFNFLGGSIASAMVNLTQVPMMTFPFLSQYENAGALAKRLASAAKIAIGPIDKLSGALGDALRRAEQDGVTAPQEIHQLTATASGSSFAGNRGVTLLLKTWGVPFAMAESFNRRVTFISAFQIGEKMTAEQLKAAGAKDAFEFAENTVNETQGLYNKGNRMNVGRGAVGATLMTFKQFSIMYLELLKRMPRKQQLMMLGIMLLAAGGGGLPFVEDVEDIIDTIGQWLGYATNSRKSLRNAAEGVLGIKGADITLNGVASQMGIDLHSRFGMQNLIPGSAILKQSSVNKGQDVQEFFGPAASVIGSVGKTLENLATGHFGRAALAVAPNAVSNAIKGGNMLATGYGEDSKGRRTIPVGSAEAVAKAIGFNPKSIADFNSVKSDLYQDQSMLQVKREEFTSAIAESILNKDEDARRKAMLELKAWNDNNPNMRIAISPSSVAQRVQAAKMEGTDRFMKSVPKAMKDMARQEFQR